VCNIEVKVNNSTETAFALLEQQATDVIDPLKIIFLSQDFLSKIGTYCPQGWGMLCQ